MEKFAIGMLLGVVGGALLVSNNYKMRTLVRKGQQEVQAKFDQMLDEKIRMADKAVDKIQDEVKEKVDELKEDKKEKKRK